MKLNPKDILFGSDRGKKPPVLLAVTPPRTGERTLLGVENLLQSIAVPEPFSLELTGDMDGVTLMARCLDDEVVRGQLSAHYPQARIRKVAEEDDPLRLEEGEQAWSMTLRSGGPDYVPLRTFRDDDLLDPVFRSPDRPAGRSVCPAAPREDRCAAAAAFPGSRLVAGPPRKGPPEAGRRAEGTRLHLPDQAPPARRRDDGRAGSGGRWRPCRATCGCRTGEAWKAALLGAGTALGMAAGGWAWWRWKKARSRVEDPILIREKVSRIAFDAEIEVVAVLPAGTRPQRAAELLEPVAAAYRHFDNPAGARFEVGKVRPAAPDPEHAASRGPPVCSAGAACSASERWRRCGTRRGPETRRPPGGALGRQGG